MTALRLQVERVDLPSGAQTTVRIVPVALDGSSYSYKMMTGITTLHSINTWTYVTRIVLQSIRYGIIVFIMKEIAFYAKN